MASNQPTAFSNFVANLSNNSQSVATTGGVDLRETNVPQQLLDDIDNFKRYVKDERSVSSEIALASPKMHLKLKTDIKALNSVVHELASQLAKQKAQIEKLRNESVMEMRNVEIAQRTIDTPPALQYENVAPYSYFNRLIADFESQMIRYARTIEETEQNMMTTAGGVNASMTPAQLVTAMQKIQSAFISLAGKYEPIHDAIKQQKVIYEQKYRQKHDTLENPFELNRKSKIKTSIAETGKLWSSFGPSPFTGKPSVMALIRSNQTTEKGQGVSTAGQVSSTSGLNAANNSFGMPPAVPATTTKSIGLGGGFSMANPAITTAALTNLFASPATTNLSNNLTSTTNSSLTQGFGLTNTFATNTQASTFPFGTSISANPTPATSVNAFGATQPSGNITFGVPATATLPFGQQQAGSGFNFIQPASTTAALTSPFATPATANVSNNLTATTNSNLTQGFGLTSAFATKTQAGLLPFGTSLSVNTTPVTSVNAFGATQPSGNFTFGAPAATTLPFGQQQGGSGFNIAQPASTAADVTNAFASFATPTLPFGQQQVFGKRGKH